MDGLALAQEMPPRRPDLPVLLTTGFSEAAASRRRARASGLLLKPYRIEMLALALRETLAEAET